MKVSPPQTIAPDGTNRSASTPWARGISAVHAWLIACALSTSLYCSATAWDDSDPGDSRPVRKLPYRVALGGGMAQTIIGGEWYDGFTASGSPAREASLRIAVIGPSYVGFDFSARSLGVLDRLKTLDGLRADWNIDLRDWFVIVGAVETNHATRGIAYVEGGFGQIHHDIRLSLSDGVSQATARSRETKFAGYLGLGMLIPVMSNLGIDVGASLRITGEEGPRQGGEEPYRKLELGYISGFRAGVILLL